MDNELWRWIWLGVAAVFGIGEIFTAGFFMLPFAAGAVVAFVLALLDVEPAIVLVVFLVTSVLVLVVIQSLVRRGDQRTVAVGANRFVGRRVLVLERVDRLAGTGRVRLDTENWRATTDGDPLEPGAEALVVEMRGTRLVVAPEDQ
ncbi:MAG TPA: NfeD family protein [Acidimicrobiia bacterium]|nr:NfeD family protein [Acidimicrobiia bacterium]